MTKIGEKVLVFLFAIVTLGYSFSKYVAEGTILADFGLIVIGILTLVEVFYFLIKKIRARTFV